MLRKQREKDKKRSDKMSSAGCVDGGTSIKRNKEKRQSHAVKIIQK